MGMNEVISIKYRWNTIAWAKFIIWNIKFKIYGVSKSIPVAKSQNFVDISGAKNPHGQNFWDLNFLSEKARLYRYYQNKNLLVHGIIPPRTKVLR